MAVVEVAAVWGCDQHRGAAAVDLARLAAGYVPIGHGNVWALVLAHLSGVRRPVFRADVPEEVWNDYLAAGWQSAAGGLYATPPPLVTAPAVPSVHRTDRPPQWVPGHWEDGTPFPDEPPDEEDLEP